MVEAAQTGASISSSWPARYQRLRPLHDAGAFDVHAASDRDGGGRLVVVVTPATECDRPRAATALDTLARAHRAVEHPVVPRVYDMAMSAAGPLYVVLDFPAVATGLSMLRHVSRQGRLLPYGAADAFIGSVREAMRTAHKTRHPTRDAPLCMGRLAYSNLLFARDGHHALFGLGHNVITDDEAGIFGGDPGCFQAPEVALQREAATPRGDYLALLLMMRSLLPLVDFPDALRSVALGQLPPPQDEVLRTSLLWFNQHVYSAVPEQRASIDEAVAVSRRIRTHFGLTLEPERFREVVAEVLGAIDQPVHALVIGPGARWLSVADGPRQAVSGRGPMRGMLLTLARRARSETAPQHGPGLTRDELFEAGWPGQRADERSRANRVYVALSKLRKLGLRDVLLHNSDGYRLSPDWRVTLRSDD